MKVDLRWAHDGGKLRVWPSRFDVESQFVRVFTIKTYQNNGMEVDMAVDGNDRWLLVDDWLQGKSTLQFLAERPSQSMGKSTGTPQGLEHCSAQQKTMFLEQIPTMSGMFCDL